MTESNGQVVCLGIGTESAKTLSRSDDLGEGVHGRVLRVALALRGGVSLAVWIGGAVAELDVARRVRIRRTPRGWDAFYIPPSDARASDLAEAELTRARVYARLLTDAGFDALDVDVLAGASAGGLNAVVYAAAQRAGASVNRLLETWQDAADIRQLLQPPGFSRVDSLLRGDYYFWPCVTRALHDLYDSDDIPRNPLHRSGTVSIDLAATIIDSADRSVPGARDTRGYFHFVGTDAPGDAARGRSIPDATGDGSDLARLAYAARSTSSYPGAFEPALIFSTTKRESDEPIGDAARIDMSYAFSAHRPTWDHPFRVIDGSILDEVPIAQAFTAARRSASPTSSSRLVLYLDPSPPVPSPRTVRPTHYGPNEPPHGPLSVLKRFTDRQSRILNVVRLGGRSPAEREPGADEIAHIERVRLALLREHARGDAYAAARLSARFEPEAAARAYVRFRAATDVEYLNAVTADPAAWQNSANISSRSVWPTWTAQDREDLQYCTETRYGSGVDERQRPSTVDAISLGSQAVLDAALCGLAWVRAIEHRRTEQDTSIATVRLRLYRVLGAATDDRDAATVQVLDAARDAPDPAERAVNAWIQAQADSDVDDLWRELDDVVSSLRALSPPDDDPEWARSPFSAFPGKPAGARDLAPYLAPRGIPEPISSLSFERLTASEPPAHLDQFGALVRRRQRGRVRIALGLAPADVTDETMARLFDVPSLTADDKLSGSLLFNFGGFLSGEWRANDWWWGRLDSAAALVRILSDRSGPTPASEDAADSVDIVQSALLDELADSHRPPLSAEHSHASTADIREAFEFGADSLDNLAPAYRLSIMSRGLRIASRALSSSTGPVGRALIALARPLAVALPTVVTPLRAAAFGATIGLAIAVTAGLTADPRPSELTITWPAHLVSAIVIAATIASAIDAERRWRNVIRRMHHVAVRMPRDTLPDIVAVHERARVQSLTLCALAIMTAVSGSAIVAVRGLDATWWILTAAASATAAHARTRALDLSPSRTPLLLYTVSTGMYVAWAALIIATPMVLAPLHADHRLVTPVTVAVTGAICSGLLTAGWLRWAPTLRGWIANPVVTSLGAALAGAAPVWVATRVTAAPFPALTTVSTVIIAIVAWGTVLWWLPEVPAGPRDRFTDDDSRRSAA
ncbi:DUF3376 domain-containing protein [Microbacterium sp. MPKO10]|uniref:DUF3376 domain-containing protein n=1 Tax=Microbacterium sp. MPKO10 TaxID=2989818 RepID=UPI0022368803|nr:DUF3376 domain-containing protein [Microbacterium sp. MPKO10]MCW4458284.1 DUF3376 domain-containing protein [Microbacterium sp. MPKO10]